MPLFETIVLLAFLFVSSKAVVNSLAHILFRVFRSRRVVIYLLALVFFLGTVVHEMAHFFMALLLLVPTGDINLFPQIHGEKVRLGSVEVARTDPVRRFLIGVAPILVGVVVLSWVIREIGIIGDVWLKALGVYGIFITANTMFSSKKDMEGAVWLLVVGVVAVGALLITGMFPQSAVVSFSNLSLFETVNRFLMIPALINGVVWVIAQLLNK